MLDGEDAMDGEMTLRERIISTFKRAKVDRIVWQPRIYYWFYGNRLRNRLPEGYEDKSLLESFYSNIQAYRGVVPDRYRDKSMLEIYDDLHASPRYPQEVLGVNIYRLEIDESSGIEVSVIDKGEGEKITITKTPVGVLREVTRHGYHVEHPVKTPKDYKIMEYILDHTEFQFDDHAFEIADREFGDNGVVQSFYPRSPLQRLIINYMGFERTVTALYRHWEETEEFMRVIEEWDDKMYRVLLGSPLEIFNFGENIDADLDSPKLFERYLAPYYNKRIEQIHARGKFCHIHMDGSIKPLLPLLREIEFDGIEAATPLPQGDVTLEELKRALGDKILLDGIPALLFLPQYPMERFKRLAQKVLEIFSPNLILGISDELPPTGDIERVKMVSEIVEDYKL
ncbi:MAG: uroporphyrinogen decarboxylase family protein [Candidatus Bathyarchaeia archaeon]